MLKRECVDISRDRCRKLVQFLYFQAGRGVCDQDGRVQLVDGVRPQLPAVSLHRPLRHHGEHPEGDGLCQDPHPQSRHRRRARAALERGVVGFLMILIYIYCPLPIVCTFYSIFLFSYFLWKLRNIFSNNDTILSILIHFFENPHKIGPNLNIF